MSLKVDNLRVGWAPVGRDEPIVLFFDGSKSRKMMRASR